MGSFTDVSGAITETLNEEGIAGATYGQLQVKVAKSTKNSIKLKWNRISGASKYVIYGVVAISGKKTLSVSKTVHVATAGGKYGIG